MIRYLAPRIIRTCSIELPHVIYQNAPLSSEVSIWSIICKSPLLGKVSLGTGVFGLSKDSASYNTVPYL